jgi:transcriptional regulator with XRE-family HTH domain
MRFSHIARHGRITAFVKKATYLAQRKKFLALLRDTRTKAGLTQVALASRMHRDQTFVSKYETGERRLDILELRDVCRALGVDFKDFVRDLDAELR